MQCRPCLLKTAQEPSVTLGTLESGGIRQSYTYRSGSRGDVLLTATDCPTGRRTFCYGQIAWDNGLSPGRTVRRAY